MIKIDLGSFLLIEITQLKTCALILKYNVELFPLIHVLHSCLSKLRGVNRQLGRQLFWDRKPTH